MYDTRVASTVFRSPPVPLSPSTHQQIGGKKNIQFDTLVGVDLCVLYVYIYKYIGGVATMSKIGIIISALFTFLC